MLCWRPIAGEQKYGGTAHTIDTFTNQAPRNRFYASDGRLLYTSDIEIEVADSRLVEDGHWAKVAYLADAKMREEKK